MREHLMFDTLNVFMLQRGMAISNLQNRDGQLNLLMTPHASYMHFNVESEEEWPGSFFHRLILNAYDA